MFYVVWPYTGIALILQGALRFWMIYAKVRAKWYAQINCQNHTRYNIALTSYQYAALFLRAEANLRCLARRVAVTAVDGFDTMAFCCSSIHGDEVMVEALKVTRRTMPAERGGGEYTRAARCGGG